MARVSTLLLGLAVLTSEVDLRAVTMVNLSLNVTQPGVPNSVCVRAIILKSDGTYLDDAWFPTTYPSVVMHGKAMAPGVSVQVPAGMTRIIVGKGPDYVPNTITTNLGLTGSSCTINVALQPALNLYEQGWRSAEMHVHYNHGEHEISRLPSQVWAICAAGGLNFVSFCEEHYGAGTLTRQQMYDQWIPYQKTECQLYMGLEEPKNAWGHHANILHDPWLIRSSLPYWAGIHSVHEQGGVSFPVHPPRLFPARSYTDPASGFKTWFLYPYNNFSKCYPLDSLIGHLTDAWSGVSDAANTPIVLPPYFQLLAMGYRIPLVADSDLCMDRINNGGKGSGCWLTYYNLEGRPLTPASVAEAMHRGRVMSTTGPLVLFNIDNAMSGDTLPADGAAHIVRIRASYTFNPWTLMNSTFDGSDITRISEIDLYRNGQIIQSWKPNTPTASVQQAISESTPNSYYMVRVVGNEGPWMAGYASPIYFDNTPRPRQPSGFKALIQGRLYDSASGLPLAGTVSCVRYAKTNWTIPTDSQGRFQVFAPLDAELIARDNAGRTFSQNVLQQEPVYAFCNYLADNYSTNMNASVGALSNIVRQMSWEFPIGYQLAASYVRASLAGDAVMSNFSIVSAPPFTPGKAHSEIAMLLVDKTQVQPGDRINYAVIFRSPRQPPSDQLVVEFRGWDTNHPQIFTKYNLEVSDDNGSATLVNLGNGFYLRQSSVVVPAWAANVTDSTAALEMYATVRPGAIAEDAQVLLRVGPTRRALLVSSTWDGLPASWAEVGIGPCNFRRDYTDFLVRYSDYRNLVVNLTLNGQPITLNPKVDTAHVADADDAEFYEQFYYDGQCEPKYRNIAFRDPVRPQPAPADFSAVPILNPPDMAPPNVVAIDPPNGASIPAGMNLFYFLVDDEGLSGPASATIYIDGTPAASTTTNPIALNLASGPHTWQVKGFDVAGNFAFSPLTSFTVGPGSTSPPPVSTVWVDDALPAGATPDADGGDGWNWISNNPTPVSGALANQSSIAPGEHEHRFTGATATLPVSGNDTLFAYVYLDPANLPAELMLQWNDGSWEHRAFWGTDAIAFGSAGIGSRRAMGKLPPAGQWTKLSVTANQVGLTNSRLNGLALTLYGGRATWDYIGKSSGTPTNNLPRSPGKITGGLSNGLWQVQVSNPGSWLYTLERSTNLQDWTPLSSRISAGGSTFLLQDANPSAPDAFYRVHIYSP
ncbi:MAG TPA: CehA/McbA family metallohydrolase [Candidatus Angelobacter sp.]|nr:CehA/McbA family metallohydrolase [Candidatus Angelobacter sp.]